MRFNTIFKQYPVMLIRQNDAFASERSSLFRSTKTEQVLSLAPFFALDWRLQVYISCAAAGDGVK